MGSTTKTILGILAFLGIAQDSRAQAVTTQQADQAIEAFNRTYWNASGKYFYKRDDRTGVLDFWMSAHAWETIMDAYVRSGKDQFKQQIKDVYDGFIARNGSDWTQNDFNDDIAWWVIACARAYEITGEVRYLNQAKSQFDWVYRTQRDSVNGGIWWKNTTHTEKNSCVVQPMIISAAFLARHLKDDTYRVKAESLYAWQRRTLVDPATGKVYDNIKTTGVRSSYSSTYNQGTWIGSGVLLNHLADAKRGADWTRANLCNSAGVFTEAGQGDVGAFKLIGARYAVGLSRVPGNVTYLQWMEANAARVWANRRADGIMGYNWNAATPATGVESQCAAGGVSLLNLLAASTLEIRPMISLTRNRPGPVKILIAHGDATATSWMFSSTDLNPDKDPASGSGFTKALRRLDGRARP